MLLADRIQIQQVVTNLILNSTEVMESVEPEMRKLIIELSTAPSTLRLRSIRLTKLAHGKQGSRKTGEYYSAGGLR
jgi:nitrogen fixation/metabolism regulation signal transduction histidine kinase